MTNIKEHLQGQLRTEQGKKDYAKKLFASYCEIIIGAEYLWMQCAFGHDYIPHESQEGYAEVKEMCIAQAKHLRDVELEKHFETNY
jgi:hypothetical protein